MEMKSTTQQRPFQVRPRRSRGCVASWNDPLIDGGGEAVEDLQIEKSNLSVHNRKK